MDPYEEYLELEMDLHGWEWTDVDAIRKVAWDEVYFDENDPFDLTL